VRKIWPYVTGVFSVVAAVVVVVTFLRGVRGPTGKRLDVSIIQWSPLVNQTIGTGAESLKLAIGNRELHDP
jgi:hypothetical protein